uniref:Fork-head domain-containing protein n=1 Tax=Catharus ustulatus TaxID=91951 RepID=A0A8C3UTQ4_CATUS
AAARSRGGSGDARGMLRGCSGDAPAPGPARAGLCLSPQRTRASSTRVKEPVWRPGEEMPVPGSCPGFPLTSEELCHYIDIPRSSQSCGASSVTASLSPPIPGDIDYKNNASLKPPYSYATLICMAMEASKEPKLTLAAICKWISDNFCYFRHAHPTWQSSIRHNLCINKRFIKVPREKGEPGRGAFWKLHPQYAEWLKSSTLKGRRTPPEHIPTASSRRAPQGARRGPSPAPPSSPRSSLEVGAELQRLLREFEEFESSHNWNPPPPSEASWFPSGASGAREEQGELTELKGSADWEALLNPPPPQPGDFSTLGQLPPPTQPGAPGQPLGWPQGQQQILAKPSPTKPGLDETLMATAFLEAAWPEETRENLSSSIPVGHGAGNTSLPGEDVMDWDSMAHLSLY